MEPHERIILSLDGFPNLLQALRAVRKIGVLGAIVKMNDLLDDNGTVACTLFKDEGFRVFADMKIHDIPETAARRTARWRDAGADFLTVHASGGCEMMKRCVEAAGDTMKILAVTVLTSFDHDTSIRLFGRPAASTARDLAVTAYRSGVQGVIASAYDVRAIRGSVALGKSPFLVVTPGIRPGWASKNDQKRVAMPAEAIRAGADYLVIGRPIFNPPPEIGSPADAFARITEEIRTA